MTARTVLQLTAGAVLATTTGVTVNLATADGASPSTWVAVVGSTVGGIAVAIWVALSNRGSPDRPGERSAGPAATVRGGNVLITERIVGSTVIQGRGDRSPVGVAAIVLLAVGAGLAFGLAYGADRDAGISGGPDPTVPASAPTTPPPAPTASPTSTVAPTPTDGDTPARTRPDAVPDEPVPEREPVAPPVELPVGTWLSLDNTFETLHLDANGRYRWEDPPRADGIGRYRLEGSRITFVDGAAAGRTFTWSVRDSLLTLNDGSRSPRTYTLN